MTKKVIKYILKAQLKITLVFLGIYMVIIGTLSLIFYYFPNIDQDWNMLSPSSPKLFLLIMGIVYPLITLELYISRGLTRKQYFIALTSVVSIESLILLLPSVVDRILAGTIDPLSLIIDYVQMPVFFLIGWTGVVGFQLGIWYKAALGLLCAFISAHIMTTIPSLLNLSEATLLGVSLVLIILQITLLPNIIRRIPIKI